MRARHPSGRIRYRKRLEVIYAGTAAERLRWRPADTAMIIKSLDRTEERVTQVINAERDVLADFMQRPVCDDPSSEDNV